MIKTKRQAIAAHLGLDFSETKDYVYHYGRTSQTVYAIDESYYCVTKGNQKPATHRDGMEWKWVEVSDAFVNKAGYKVWKSEVVNN